MSKFRKKPIVIEAVQFYAAMPTWPEGVRASGNPHDPRPVIDTLEGQHAVTEGDWIITGVKGERYPCKPDIFAATYEQADEAEPADEIATTSGDHDQGDKRDEI